MTETATQRRDRMNKQAAENLHKAHIAYHNALIDYKHRKLTVQNEQRHLHVYRVDGHGRIHDVLFIRKDTDNAQRS